MTDLTCDVRMLRGTWGSPENETSSQFLPTAHNPVSAIAAEWRANRVLDDVGPSLYEVVFFFFRFGIEEVVINMPGANDVFRGCTTRSKWAGYGVVQYLTYPQLRFPLGFRPLYFAKSHINLFQKKNKLKTTPNIGADYPPALRIGGGDASPASNPNGATPGCVTMQLL